MSSQLLPCKRQWRLHPNILMHFFSHRLFLVSAREKSERGEIGKGKPPKGAGELAWGSWSLKNTQDRSSWELVSHPLTLSSSCSKGWLDQVPCTTRSTQSPSKGTVHESLSEVTLGLPPSPWNVCPSCVCPSSPLVFPSISTQIFIFPGLT